MSISMMDAVHCEECEEFVSADENDDCPGCGLHFEFDGPDNDDWIHKAYLRQARPNPLR